MGMEREGTTSSLDSRKKRFGKRVRSKARCFGERLCRKRDVGGRREQILMKGGAWGVGGKKSQGAKKNPKNLRFFSSGKLAPAGGERKGKGCIEAHWEKEKASVRT